MDAVFGEEEYEERMDNESDEDEDETTSLLGPGLPTNNGAIGETGPRRRSRGWLSSMFKSNDEGSQQATN